MKRVYCLYRVSTKGQVEKDDIPMQKQACHEFVAEQSDWHIEKEFSEKGVSGFKIAAKDRDAIQDLQKAAVEKKFDVLLVFMFDRIGRKEDETPFVVEWFVRQGVEVWSVKEGQQRFDTHVDKLLNYIRFWQASGESIKTSIRTRTRMEQLVKEGHFKGGTAPYGYRLVHKGRVNKRGHEVFDLEIDEYESTVVRRIFHLHTAYGMGPQTLSRRLTEDGILNRAGKNFVAPSIRNILTNPIYKGVLRFWETLSEPFEHLKIIDDETFRLSQELVEQRSRNREELRRVPRRLAKNCLLVGNIFCGHCGGRLVTSTAGTRYQRANGEEVYRRWWRYLCYNRVRHKGECCGQTGYSAERIDEAVRESIRKLLDGLKKVPMQTVVERRYGLAVDDLEKRLNEARRIEAKSERGIKALKAELAPALMGESKFDPDLLGDAIQAAQVELDEARRLVNNLENELADTETIIRTLERQHSRLVSLSELFDGCDLDAQRMVISQLVDGVYVSSGYQIELRLNVTLEQYVECMDEARAGGEKTTMVLTA